MAEAARGSAGRLDMQPLAAMRHPLNDIDEAVACFFGSSDAATIELLEDADLRLRSAVSGI